MKFRSFLEYYEDEINYLVDSGQELKSFYPNFSNFDFSAESSDPDIKKLIEGTAFLNANLQKKIDEKNIELSQEMLNALYPYFNRPTPSFCVFELKNVASKVTIPKLTKIKSITNFQGENFHFLTSHKIQTSSFQITNIEITNALDLPRSIMKMTNTAITISIKKIFNNPEKEIIFFINKMENSAASLYEALFSFYPSQNTPVFENGEQIGEIDFHDDFSILPQLNNENNSFAPVIDFSLLKEKFLFFKIRLEKAPVDKIQIPIKSHNAITISKTSLLLNCFIGVNLLSKTSDPIAIDHKQHKYKLFIKPNEDIYAIYDLINIQNSHQKFIHYFSLDFANKKEKDILWYYKKDHNINTSTFLYLFDESFESKTIFAKTLCTQKNANKLVSINEKWTLENFYFKCINIKKPTKYQASSNHLPAQRKIMYFLNLNFYGLENQDIIKNIKTLFNVFHNSEEYSHYLNNLIDLSVTTKMIPIQSMMVPKMFITIKMNKHPFSFLLARVISKLFAATIGMNKKIGITLINNENNMIWKEWDIK